MSLYVYIWRCHILSGKKFGEKNEGKDDYLAGIYLLLICVPFDSLV